MTEVGSAVYNSKKLTAAEENEAAAAVNSWELAVVDDEKRTCFWEQMKAGGGARRSKVVKLHAGKLNTFTTRVATAAPALKYLKRLPVAKISKAVEK
ncbi:hypothetical protein DIPPA_09466 [Diplonema papillatum]|nr:hypothetical protein DIPPA_09466 [Diplonema papillatum]